MWNKLIHDFGDVPEETKLSCTFNYEGTNNITSVVPACSCSAVTLTSNSIEVIYNTPQIPAGLPSMYFEKSVEVFFNNSQERETLIIKGKIVNING